MRPKFIIDSNVGKLAPWLRILGYDTLFINPIDDDRLVEIAQQEHRVVLTKDTGIMKRRHISDGSIAALLIEGTDWEQQLVQVVRCYRLDRSRQFSRCVTCNNELTEAAREHAMQRVPQKVWSINQHFQYCEQCNQYYWNGSHWQRMMRVLDSILK